MIERGAAGGMQCAGVARHFGCAADSDAIAQPRDGDLVAFVPVDSVNK
jgi:hypothetical protein